MSDFTSINEPSIPAKEEVELIEDVQEETAAEATPKKAAKKGAKGTPKSAAKSTPKKRASPVKNADGSPGKKTKFNEISESYEGLHDNDKYLIRLREDEKKGWADIDKAFELLTGTRPAATTLRKRYGRIKATITRVKDEDLAALKTAFAESNVEIEEETKALQKKIWSRVADKMLASCKDKYDAATLEKSFKKFCAGSNTIQTAAAAATPPPDTESDGQDEAEV